MKLTSLLLLILVAPADAQTPRHYADCKFNDGSVVKLAIIQDTIDVKTKYGTLKVPLNEIESIEFGAHLTPELASKIDFNIAQLSAPDYRQREEARKQLCIIGHWAYHKIVKVINNADVETLQRASSILQHLRISYTNDHLNRPEKDIITTTRFKVVGVISNHYFTVHSGVFGTSNIGVHNLEKINFRDLRRTDSFVIISNKDWIGTKINIDPQLRLRIVAAGQVDLYPEEKGCYATGPTGMLTMGRETTLPAGALVGRIGDGEAFVIGSDFCGVLPRSGELSLKIINSPWNTVSTGCYLVDISTTHVEMSSR